MVVLSLSNTRKKQCNGCIGLQQDSINPIKLVVQTIVFFFEKENAAVKGSQVCKRNSSLLSNH